MPNEEWAEVGKQTVGSGNDTCTCRLSIHVRVLHGKVDFPLYFHIYFHRARNTTMMGGGEGGGTVIPPYSNEGGTIIPIPIKSSPTPQQEFFPLTFFYTQ